MTKNYEYKLKLDGLRCVAIMLVLLEHFAYVIGSKVSGGFYGVNLFFVISGFLITSILMKNAEQGFFQSYKLFLGRRFLRIFPIYYLTIFFLVLINTKGIKGDLFYLLTYSYNYRLGYTEDWSPVYKLYWSLSVEEQFYIFFPIIIILLRKNLKAILVVCILFVLVADIQILFNSFHSSKYNYVGLLTNMAPLSIGAIGAVLMGMGLIPEKFFSSIAVEVFMFILLIFLLTSDSWTLRMTACPFLSLYLVIKSTSFQFSLLTVEKVLSNKWVVFTGRVSYGVYVYHLILGTFFTQYLFDPLWTKIPFSELGVFRKVEYNSWIVKLPIITVLSIGFAYLSYILIEKPLLNLKDKYFRY